jgi:hypothetical protein
MATTSLTAKMVMDKSASLMNDTARTVYTYDAQLPYLQMALDELLEEFELSNIPVTNQVTSDEIQIPVGTRDIGPKVGTGVTATPNYPENLVEIQQVWERLYGSSEPFISMKKQEFLSHTLDGLPVSELQYWAWDGQRIKTYGASTPRGIKLDYIGKLFPDNITADTLIGIVNARSFLQYRTAALCSQYIGENASRAEALNGAATDARDRVLGIGAKGRQSIPVRRRPFMSAYKRRTFI